MRALHGHHLDQVADAVGDKKVVADSLKRCQLLAALVARLGRNHGFLIPFEERDDVVEVANLGHLLAQGFGRGLGAAGRAFGNAQIARLARNQDGRHAAVLGHVDHVLLRHAAHGAEPVVGRGKAHHHIKRLVEHAPLGADHGEFGDGQLGRALQHPGFVAIVALGGGIVEQRFPFAVRHVGAERHAFAAIAAVRLQHQVLAVLARVFQKIAFGAVGQRGLAVLDEARPQHVAAEQPAFLAGEERLGQVWIGQDLEAALVVEVADDGGNHPVLLEQHAHAVERPAQLFFQFDEIAGFVVAIGDVDAVVAVIDVAVPDIELARIGVARDQLVALLDKVAEHRLFGRSAHFIFGLDHAQIAAGTADGTRVVDEKLHEQFALIARQLDFQFRIVRQEGGHDVLHHHPLGDRAVMDAAHARKIGLHEVERVLPLCGRKVAHRVQPPVHRIGAMMRAAPHFAYPAFLLGRDAHDVAHAFVLQIKPRDAFQRVVHLKADVVHIGKLLVHRQERPQHDAHGLDAFVALVQHAGLHGLGVQMFGEAGKRGVGHVVRGAADAPFERSAGKAEGFTGAEHGCFQMRELNP